MSVNGAKGSDTAASLTLLGSGKTVYPAEYSPALLEAFDNKFPDRDYFVEFNCPEFTCLCPITGQPDFAKITVKYIPNIKMVESKSLKLYLFSFRNHGGFHEDSVNIIMRDLVNLMSPKYIEVLGEFTPRGGISIHPFVNYGMDEKWQGFAMKRMEKY
ncbi:MAG: preQ(1) synthase [Ruminococcus sp.]|jgi:7-cyano-7-deazaguanine reductase|nr:preQ(1) synthase [Ruminococcus sp.]